MSEPPAPATAAKGLGDAFFTWFFFSFLFVWLTLALPVLAAGLLGLTPGPWSVRAAAFVAAAGWVGFHFGPPFPGKRWLTAAVAASPGAVFAFVAVLFPLHAATTPFPLGQVPAGFHWQYLPAGVAGLLSAASGVRHRLLGTTPWISRAIGATAFTLGGPANAKERNEREQKDP